ncbi:hypothetical protein FSP39_018171 [Pinctada imbricata]|uniref:Uncharacterized protein n=1 Tax=Pinctada imbricata TaxID=66713 RepID=A0AA88Y8F4_PINIB|nr:hypothetical protein FSP39_018171 [Pinctada imbricata]
MPTSSSDHPETTQRLASDQSATLTFYDVLEIYLVVTLWEKNIKNAEIMKELLMTNIAFDGNVEVGTTTTLRIGSESDRVMALLIKEGRLDSALNALTHYLQEEFGNFWISDIDC